MPPKRTKKVPEVVAETLAVTKTLAVTETLAVAETPETVTPKPRAPKKAKAVAAPSSSVTNANAVASFPVASLEEDDKRGRKPRGGKIVLKPTPASAPQPQLTNVVLNLKCSMVDLREYTNKLNNMIINPLEYNSAAPPEVRYYEGTQTFTSFDSNIEKSANYSHDNSKSSSLRAPGQLQPSRPINVPAEHETQPNEPQAEDDSAEDKSVNTKEMAAKLKQLKLQLYKNALQNEKKSACFWCTYDFDNSPCYIPKYEMDGVIYGYGSFCRPECAVAYLMKESIDDSTKFDRYHLLNQIYSKVYDCKKNIKPAPNPHYLLEKFYGNLTIQEYRKLLKTDHLLLVIDKPMTRILPELHEDTDDAFTKIYGIKTNTGTASGVFKVKRQSEQPTGPSKASIVRNSFGLPS